MAAPRRCHMFFITPSPKLLHRRAVGLRHSFGGLKAPSSQAVLWLRTALFR